MTMILMVLAVMIGILIALMLALGSALLFLRFRVASYDFAMKKKGDIEKEQEKLKLSIESPQDIFAAMQEHEGINSWP